MRRALRNFLSDMVMTRTSDLKQITPSRYIVNVSLPSGKWAPDGLRIYIRKRKILGSYRLEFSASYFNNYLLSFERHTLPSELRNQSLANAFDEWIENKVIPALKEEVQYEEETIAIKMMADRIENKDPRISVAMNVDDGGFEITFRVDDLTDAAKLADFYREYFGGTSLPRAWYMVDGIPKEDWERYYREERENQYPENEKKGA